jgi:hypothetical protein
MLTRLKLLFDDMRSVNRIMYFLFALILGVALARGDIVQFYTDAATEYL